MIALISDIHGNYVALTEVLRAIDGLNVNATYCLGDVVGYYPQVNECCEVLRQRAVQCVLGNHDWHMISGTFCPRSNTANDCLRYQRQIITESNLAWIAAFPVYRKIGELSLVHGGWTNPLDEYLAPSEEQFRAMPDRYCASGHTHKQLITRFGDKVYCNPGSVGQPRDGCNKAAFATFDGHEFRLFRIDYDIDRVCQVTAQAGFSEYYYNRLRTGAAHFSL
jgi:predicted phosphodiesterase